MYKQVMFRLLGGSVLLVGLALIVFLVGRSPALAMGRSAPTPGPTNQQKYCEVYEHALAARLTHGSVAQLAAANKLALEATVRQAYTDGAINRAQETSMLSKINKLGADPCVDLARAAAAHRAWHARAHQAVVTAVAGALKLPAATLESDLSSGQTVAQIAAAQHVSIADVNAAYLAAVQAQLKTAVTNGAIMQSEADKTYLAIQHAVAGGKYPLLETRA